MTSAIQTTQEARFFLCWGGSNPDTMAFCRSARMLLFLPSSLPLFTELHLLTNKLETYATSWITFSSTWIVTMNEKRVTICLREFSGCTMGPKHTQPGHLSVARTSSREVLFPLDQPVNVSIGMGDLVTEQF